MFDPYVISFTEGLDAEELELELIDFGAEEVFEDEKIYFNYALFKFWNHPKELEKSQP
jgi:hypothetical protein